jgi:hypothetical protein
MQVLDTPRRGDKHYMGLPPSRLVTIHATVHNADPRWPMIEPNTVCSACGRGPKHPDGEIMQVLSVFKMLAMSHARG